MLRKSALFSVKALSESLQGKGIVLSTSTNSELSELVRMSAPVFNFNVNSDVPMPYEEFANIISIGTQDESDCSEHTLQLNALTEQLGSLVTSHIFYAKNVVRPLVVKFAEALQQYKENSKGIDASTMFDVKVENLPEIMMDSSFLGTLEYYDGKSILVPSKSINLEMKSEEDIRAMMLTGSSRVDNLINEWLLTLPSTFASDIWTQFFVTGSGSFNLTQSVYQYQAARESLAVLLLSNKLFAEVAAGRNESLGSYKSVVDEYREWAGALLSVSLKKIATSIKVKQLVLAIQNDGKKIVLNGIVYNEWLQEGGKPEIILGLATTGQFISQRSAIDEKAKEYESAWYSYCSYFKTIEANKVFQNFKDQLLHLFSVSYNEQDETEKEYLLKNPNVAQVSLDLFKAEVDSLKPNDMNDVFGLALCAIAKCRFGYTSAYQILNDINEVGKANPNIDVREAALLAAINYLSCYVANQISVVNG